MCWLYYMPNLLVIQYLETLLLCGNNVKVVYKRVWRIDRACAIKRQLATRSRNWLASGASSKCVTRVEHARSWRVRTAGSLQEKNYKLAFLLFGNWNSRLIPVANDSLVHPVLLKTNFSHSISYPTINTLIPTKCRKLLERILREKSQRTTRLIHPQSYTFDSTKFIYSHPLHCHTYERISSQILTSSHSEWEGSWCLWSSSRENQFILVDAMG